MRAYIRKPLFLQVYLSISSTSVCGSHPTLAMLRIGRAPFRPVPNDGRRSGTGLGLRRDITHRDAATSCESPSEVMRAMQTTTLKMHSVCAAQDSLVGRYSKRKNFWWVSHHPRRFFLGGSNEPQQQCPITYFPFYESEAWTGPQESDAIAPRNWDKEHRGYVPS